jgi:hypothetical protein
MTAGYHIHILNNYYAAPQVGSLSEIYVAHYCSDQKPATNAGPNTAYHIKPHFSHSGLTGLVTCRENSGGMVMPVVRCTEDE